MTLVRDFLVGTMVEQYFIGISMPAPCTYTLMIGKK